MDQVYQSQVSPAAALFSADALYTSLLENSTDGLVAIDPDGKLFAWNPAMALLSGLSREEVLGTEVRQELPFFRVFDWESILRQVLAGERVVLEDQHFDDPVTGKRTWFNSTFFPCRQADQHICGLLGILHVTTRHKEAEQDLRRRKQLFKLLAEHATDLISRHDETGVILYLSPSVKALLGYEPEELIGRQIYELFHPDDISQIRAKHERGLADLSTQQVTYRIRHKDGHHRWFESIAKPLKEVLAEAVTELHVVSRDVTERKLAEEATRKNEQLLQGLLQHLPVVIARVTAAGMVAELKAKEDPEQTPAAGAPFTLGANLLDQKGEEAAQLKRALKGQTVSFVQQLEQPGRAPVYYQKYFFPDGQDVLGFAIDISQQKEAELKLLEEQHFIRQITDAAPFVITLYDLVHKKLLYVNQQLQELLGFTEEELKEQTATGSSQLLHPDDQPRVAEHMSRVQQLKDGEVLKCEFRMRHKNGTYHWYCISNTVFRRNAQGGAIESLGVTYEIDALRKSKDLLAGVLNSSLSSIAALRPVASAAGQITDFVYTLANHATAQLLGWAEEKLEGSRLTVVLPRIKEAGLFSRLVQVMETGEPLKEEIHFSHRRLKGWFYVTAVRMEDGLMLTLADVTARKDAEVTLRKSEALLSEAQEIARLGIWEWDLEKQQVSWSDELYRIYDLQPQAQPMSYAQYLDLLHPADRSQVEEQMQRSLQTGEPFRTQHRIRPDQQGVTKTLVVKGRVLTDETQQPLKMIGTALDITELLEARQELEQMRQIRLLGEAIPQIVLTARPDGGIDYFNQRWFDFTGLSEHESLGWGWQQVLHPEDRSQTTRAWARSVKGGQVYQVENRLFGADGSYRWHLSRAVPLTDAKGTILKWFGTCTDIHDQKKAIQQLQDAQAVLSEYNQELNAKNAQLKKINTDLDNFIYTASHDLKAPIHNIEGLVEVLQQELPAEDVVVTQVLGMIRGAINRFKKTILDLADITKAERDIQEDLAMVYLPDLLEEVKQDVRQLISENNALIKADFQVKELHFSPKNIRSILYNLLSNAIKYRSPDRQPEIVIRTKPMPDNFVLLTVRDNGLGLDEKNTHKIFEMFKRVHAHVEGTGIGLYILKRVVENAGGRIEVESRLGEGTTFRLYLKQ